MNSTFPAAASRLTIQLPEPGEALPTRDVTGDHGLDARNEPHAETPLAYASVQRYSAYLNESINRALQFAVFEPNDEPLWASVRAAVADFLRGEWQGGALKGVRPEEAYFVKCDRSTMSQNDLDNGRLVVSIGVATLKPAEFVILRFSTATASSRG